MEFLVLEITWHYGHALQSEYDVVSKISPDIAESPQKEDLRDSIKSTQKNYPETIPSVMARLSEILQK